MQYLLKEVGDEGDFLHAEEHEGFLQITTMVLIGMVDHSQILQNCKFAMSLQYLKHKVRDEVGIIIFDGSMSKVPKIGS